jgi:arginine exporter protein ArgO
MISGADMVESSGAFTTGNPMVDAMVGAVGVLFVMVIGWRIVSNQMLREQQLVRSITNMKRADPQFTSRVQQKMKRRNNDNDDDDDDFYY